MNYDSARTQRIGLYVVMASVLSVIAHGVSAQTPLTEWIPQSLIAKPCRYFVDGAERLEWETRKDRENRFRFVWLMRNKEGQTGQCNPLKGFDNTCERVTWIARVNTKRELTGWTFPDRAQAVYIFEDGIEPSDFCLGK